MHKIVPYLRQSIVIVQRNGVVLRQVPESVDRRTVDDLFDLIDVVSPAVQCTRAESTATYSLGTMNVQMFSDCQGHR